MNRGMRYVLLVLFSGTLVLVAGSQSATALKADKAATKQVRIGVDMQLGFQQCLDSWQPVAEYLSKALPGYRFVIIPLASHQDVDRTLEERDADFVILDPAMEIRANDRYGATPLVTMAETSADEPRPHPSNAGCSGTLIRRADRPDIARIGDLRGKQVSAVKPWSLTGWIAQWGLLEKNGIDPQKDLKQVVFEGTNGQVINSVLNGSADVGAVDTDMLLHLIRAKKISQDSLYFINRQGRAGPLVMGQSAASTDTYPGRVLSRTETVSDAFAERVAGALLKQDVDISVNHVPYRVSWTLACNYGKVRRLLRTLMGPDYAESPGFPLPRHYPAWWLPVVFAVGTLAAFMIAIVFMRNRCGWREETLKQELDDIRCELVESRAEGQRVNTILTLAGCGIDIIDDENRIVYADSGLKREYGDWHGRKCHEYYFGSDTPCLNCRRPGSSVAQSLTMRDTGGLESPPVDDPHAKIHHAESESMRMIGIPFRDEGGRWLYARMHLPLATFAPVHSP